MYHRIIGRQNSTYTSNYPSAYILRPICLRLTSGPLISRTKQGPSFDRTLSSLPFTRRPPPPLPSPLPFTRRRPVLQPGSSSPLGPAPPLPSAARRGSPFPLGPAARPPLRRPCRRSPAAPPRSLPSNRVAVPRLRSRASAAASPAAGATLLERDGAAVAVREFVTLDELHAAVRLRIRTFYEYAVESVGAEYHTMCNVLFMAMTEFQKDVSLLS
ncbi:early nodulin-11-like [Miscanthus floridulus]|uniref:early nodulin-11-like n=1 Tax=Miscanthus floridulus TaxID=154761 RepID=UPI0034594F77